MGSHTAGKGRHVAREFHVGILELYAERLLAGMIFHHLDKVVDGIVIHLCHVKLEDHLFTRVLQQRIQQPHLRDAELQILGYHTATVSGYRRECSSEGT